MDVYVPIHSLPWPNQTFLNIQDYNQGSYFVSKRIRVLYGKMLKKYSSFLFDSYRNPYTTTKNGFLPFKHNSKCLKKFHQTQAFKLWLIHDNISKEIDWSQIKQARNVKHLHISRVPPYKSLILLRHLKSLESISLKTKSLIDNLYPYINFISKYVRLKSLNFRQLHEKWVSKNLPRILPGVENRLKKMRYLKSITIDRYDRVYSLEALNNSLSLLKMEKLQSFDIRVSSINLDNLMNEEFIFKQLVKKLDYFALTSEQMDENRYEKKYAMNFELRKEILQHTNYKLLIQGSKFQNSCIELINSADNIKALELSTLLTYNTDLEQAITSRKDLEYLHIGIIPEDFQNSGLIQISKLNISCLTRDVCARFMNLKQLYSTIHADFEDIKMILKNPNMIPQLERLTLELEYYSKWQDVKIEDKIEINELVIYDYSQNLNINYFLKYFKVKKLIYKFLLTFKSQLAINSDESVFVSDSLIINLRNAPSQTEDFNKWLYSIKKLEVPNILIEGQSGKIFEKAPF